MAHGAMTIYVAQLSMNLTQQVSDTAVYTYNVDVEGSRMCKINGTYYILNDSQGTSVEYVMKASSVFGPYTLPILSNAPASPIPDSGIPHQRKPFKIVQHHFFHLSDSDAF